MNQEASLLIYVETSDVPPVSLADQSAKPTVPVDAIQGAIDNANSALRTTEYNNASYCKHYKIHSTGCPKNPRQVDLFPYFLLWIPSYHSVMAFFRGNIIK